MNMSSGFIKKFRLRGEVFSGEITNLHLIHGRGELKFAKQT